jgi:hypothetical protein
MSRRLGMVGQQLKTDFERVFRSMLVTPPNEKILPD